MNFKVSSISFGMAIRLPNNKVQTYCDVVRDKVEILFENGIFWISDPKTPNDPPIGVMTANVRQFTPELKPAVQVQAKSKGQALNA